MAEKILVVDDEVLILTAVERALAKVGYQVVRAQNSAELGSVLGSGPFDLLITDVYMEDESADEIIEKVKVSSPAVKVIKMSGIVQKQKSEYFIEKPFSIADLRAMVKQILNEPS